MSLTYLNDFFFVEFSRNIKT